MKKTILYGFTYLLWMISLVGCKPEVEIGYKPPIIPIRVSINGNGELKIGLSGDVVTPVGTFDIAGGMTVAAIRGQYDQNVLIVRVDDQAAVYELEDGKEFDVIFDDNTLYKKVALKHESNGDIILELESVNDLSSIADTEPIVQQTTSEYWCDDLSGVKLQVGDQAKIVWPKVNLRSAPVVPNDFYENIITPLEEGTTLSIIGGPECAHNGTWWEIRTDNGQTGWMREFISDGYLMQ